MTALHVSSNMISTNVPQVGHKGLWFAQYLNDVVKCPHNFNYVCTKGRAVIQLSKWSISEASTGEEDLIIWVLGKYPAIIYFIYVFFIMFLYNRPCRKVKATGLTFKRD